MKKTIIIFLFIIFSSSFSLAKNNGKITVKEVERGFSKDRKDGCRTAKSCRNWFRYMAGYNHRSTLIKFYDDNDGYGVVQFQSNKHLRINKPRDMKDLFRKYPSGLNNVLNGLKTAIHGYLKS